MVLCALVLSVGLVGSAFAHKSQVVGEYKLEVGWEKEPPIAGKKNAIEIMITRATAAEMNMSEEEHAKHQKEMTAEKKTTNSKTKSEKKTTKNDHDNHDKHEKHSKKETKSTKKTDAKKAAKKADGISGIKGLEASIALNGKKTFLDMKEDKKKPGRYYGAFTPDKDGYPTVHVYAKIAGTDVEATLHPEKVEVAKSK
jgi:negative regulator of genetic competence, sporulation and motility